MNKTITKNPVIRLKNRSQVMTECQEDEQFVKKSVYDEMRQIAEEEYDRVYNDYCEEETRKRAIEKVLEKNSMKLKQQQDEIDYYRDVVEEKTKTKCIRVDNERIKKHFQKRKEKLRKYREENLERIEQEYMNKYGHLL